MTLRVVKYNDAMSRWESNARERLHQAALELFAKQGFAETTVPQITARAGLTTRTFFRHFADKREALFAGEDDVLARITDVMDHAPASLSPMALIAHGLETLAENSFQGRRGYLRTRRAVVQKDEGLRDRDMRKSSAITATVAAGFRRRGMDDLSSVITAQIATTAFGIAIALWLDQDDEQTERPLSEIVRDALVGVQSALAALIV